MLVGVCGFLVFLILGQDVKGGGLAGALGGGSVQSAFGSRTTETVLKMTAGLIAVVFLMVILLIKLHMMGSTELTGGQLMPPTTGTPAPASAPATTP